MITSEQILLNNGLMQTASSGDTKATALLLRCCKTSELWILNSMDPIILGTFGLLPLVRLEIARRLVQEIINDQPEIEI